MSVAQCCGVCACGETRVRPRPRTTSTWEKSAAAAAACVSSAMQVICSPCSPPASPCRASLRAMCRLFNAADAVCRLLWFLTTGLLRCKGYGARCPWNASRCASPAPPLRVCHALAPGWHFRCRFGQARHLMQTLFHTKAFLHEGFLCRTLLGAAGASHSEETRTGMLLQRHGGKHT